MTNMIHNDDNLELEYAEFVLATTNRLNAIQDKFDGIEARLTALESRLDQHYLVINQVLTRMVVYDIDTAYFVKNVTHNFCAITEGHNRLIKDLVDCVKRDGAISSITVSSLNKSRVRKSNTEF